MKCDHLIGRTFDGDVYILASDVMEAVSELKQKLQDNCIHCPVKEQEDDVIAELKDKLMPCINGDCILTCEVVEKYGKENAELKAKLENVQASMYADVVDANMENRRLRRALWIARAEMAKEKQQLFHFSLGYEKLCIDGFYDPYSGRRELSPKQWIKVFNKVEVKLLKKAEEYK